MKDLEFQTLIILFPTLPDDILGKINLGSVTLAKDGREYKLDIVYTTKEWGNNSLVCDLEEDEETFPDCNYSLTAEDILSGDLDTATVYISGEDEDFVEPSYIQLVVRCNGKLEKVELTLED